MLTALHQEEAYLWSKWLSNGTRRHTWGEFGMPRSKMSPAPYRKGSLGSPSPFSFHWSILAPWNLMEMPKGGSCLCTQQEQTLKFRLSKRIKNKHKKSFKKRLPKFWLITQNKDSSRIESCHPLQTWKKENFPQPWKLLWISGQGLEESKPARTTACPCCPRDWMPLPLPPHTSPLLTWNRREECPPYIMDEKVLNSEICFLFRVLLVP